MRTLIHLSDLHFGRIEQAVLAPLLETVAAIKPDVVAISGDLTQRAKPEEFQQARAFLDLLPRPQIVVPGNHDVPLHNLYDRFYHPLDEYRRYITNDLDPCYYDGEIAVIGVNTARSLTWKGGRISNTQITRIEQRLCHFGPSRIKVLVTHHPVDLPASFRNHMLVGRSRLAMTKLAHCGVDLLLAGHFHTSHTGNTAERHALAGPAAIFAQAGTATSTRGRGESNSFNVIRITPQRIHVTRMSWAPESASFAVNCGEAFSWTSNGWSPE